MNSPKKSKSFILYLICENPAILAAFQTFIFISFYQLMFALLESLGKEVSRGEIGWGIAVYYSVFIVAVLGFVGSLLSVLIFRKHRILIQIIAFAVFVVYFFQLLDGRPYRASLLFLSAFVGLLTPFLLFRHKFNRLPVGLR